MIELRYLAFAVGYRRISLVLLEHGRLVTWQTSCKAASSNKAANDFVQEALAILRPHVIVFQELNSECRKGKQAKARLSVIADAVRTHPAQTLKLTPCRNFPSRFQEAAHLATLYPEIADKVPIRRFFDREPHHAVLFEALALADRAMNGSSQLLASQM